MIKILLLIFLLACEYNSNRKDFYSRNPSKKKGFKKANQFN